MGVEVTCPVFTFNVEGGVPASAVKHCRYCAKLALEIRGRSCALIEYTKLGEMISES